MHPDLEHLLVADSYDRRIRDLRKKKARLLETLASAETRHEERTSTLADLDRRLKDNGTRQRELQRSIESYEARRRSANRVLEGGGGDPEAAERQLASVSDKLDELETDLLERMEEQESLTAAQQEASVALVDATDFLTAERARHTPAMHALRATFEGILPKRKEALDGVDSQMRDRYESLVKRKGRALSEVKQGSCSACQMVVRQQHIADLNRGLIQTCGGCGRWLVLPT